MKKTATLLALLVLMVSGMTAQTYHPFPSSNTVWGEIYRKNGDSNFRVIYYGLLNNDTVINAITYHKLYQSPDTVFQETEYYGAIRDDSTARKVYFLPRNISTPANEQLLFDFTLQNGDTLKGNANNGRNNWRTNLPVNNVDSVLLDGSYRKRISFVFPYPTVWVEGIGNIVRGLMFPTGTLPINGTWAELVCMRQHDQWWYHHPQSWLFPGHTFPSRCEDLLLENPSGVDEIALNDRYVRFYPNPVTGDSRLQLLAPGRYETLEVFNATGVRVSTITVNHKTEVLIQRKDFVPGFYVYRLAGRSNAAVCGRFSVE